MTSANDVAVMTSPRDDINSEDLARAGVWKSLTARGALELLRRIFWWRVTERGSSNDG